ncbi:SipW-dependent-type signal peptide-containing protein [Georgenia alba]|uniref:SipW-dependent-type signal peptide-containing protein n=1 Tax=Georgenia alba TaxID=2233858 RepID=A0ABW2Q7A4_9MICO
MSSSTLPIDDTRRRKVRALLAGGLVLGVGAAVTLAAWNDSEFAAGTFAAGSFNLEGSTTSAADGYADHASADGAADLEFVLADVAANLSPDDVVYAPFWVRLDAGTTSPATMVGSAVTADGDNAANLSYEVLAIDAAATCDETATGETVASGATLTDFTAGSEVALPIGDGAAGAPVQLCFVVTAGADLVQGGTATATWQFDATSVDEA